MWRNLLFDTLYRLGRPIWDTPPPEELRDAIEGPNAIPPEHVLDVGCGTGTNVIYLAQHGPFPPSVPPANTKAWV